MGRRFKPHEAVAQTRKRSDYRVSAMLREGPSGRTGHDSYVAECDRQMAIASKDIKVGTFIVQDGEKIPRKVDAILPDFQLQLAFYSQLVCPTKVTIHTKKR